jgi:hypothetical protein
MNRERQLRAGSTLSQSGNRRRAMLVSGARRGWPASTIAGLKSAARKAGRPKSYRVVFPPARCPRRRSGVSPMKGCRETLAMPTARLNSMSSIRGTFERLRGRCKSRTKIRPERSKRFAAQPGRPFRCRLFARSAGVHVDFHAHRHFGNLWSFPGHSGSPKLFLTRRSRQRRT